MVQERNATGTYAAVSDEDRLRVEEQIFAYEVEISRLKRVLNRGALVMRLPEELLCDIFDLCRLDEVGHCLSEAYITSNPRTQPQLPLQKWVNVAHVCHHWREVVLGKQTFWSYITTERADCVAAMITRSGDAPLLVDGRICDSPKQRLVDMQRSWQHVMGVSPRIQSLRSPFPSPRLWRLTTCATPRFPNLDSLTVEVSDTFMTVPEDLAENNLYLPSRDFPRLRHLTTLSLTLEDARSFLQPTLRSLRMEAFIQRSREVDTWAQLLNTLAEVPQLEHLNIHSSFRNVPTPVATPTTLMLDRVVHLPHLQSLRLFCADGGWKLALLLHNLAHPPQTRIFVRYGAFQQSEDPVARGISQEDEFAALSAALATKLGTATLRTLRITVIASHCHIEGWDVPCVAPGTAPHAPPLVTFCTFEHSAFAHLRLGLEPLTRAEHVVLDGRECSPSSVVRLHMARAFRAFTGVRTLAVSTGFVRMLLEALGVDDGTGRCVLPALRVLHVQLYRFGRDTHESPAYAIALASVPALLRRRYEQFGHRLEKIVFSNCSGVKEGDIDSLRAEVGEVVWDGLLGDRA